MRHLLGSLNKNLQILYVSLQLFKNLEYIIVFKVSFFSSDKMFGIMLSKNCVIKALATKENKFNGQ